MRGVKRRRGKKQKVDVLILVLHQWKSPKG